MTRSRTELMVARLRDMQAASPEIEASAVVSVDGLIIASALPQGVEEDRVGAKARARPARRHVVLGMHLEPQPVRGAPERGVEVFGLEPEARGRRHGQRFISASEPMPLGVVIVVQVQLGLADALPVHGRQAEQVLLGVTGSGKTFVMANLIEKLQKPTLVISHNKTLAAQLASEFREFFPENAVCYFVSYYDYYQPEAYIPKTDMYIEKDADINEEIEKYRNYATQMLLTRRDVVVVASVSCIYGLGDPQNYSDLFRIIFDHTVDNGIDK